jgi:tRNA threonylcarbamoyladenosine biosynthesis protein TsaE
MPILSQNTFEFFSRSPDQTRRLGARLGAMISAGDVICLAGDLGSGKTTLVQGIAQGWGSVDAVTSPTFVLVNEYRRTDGALLNHLDAYRLSNAAEAEDLDLVRMMEVGAMVVEWAERVRTALPGENLWIDLKWIADEQRNLFFTPNGERYRSLLSGYRNSVLGT